MIDKEGIAFGELAPDFDLPDALTGGFHTTSHAPATTSRMNYTRDVNF